MMTLLLFLACETAQPLPPSAQVQPEPTAQRVKVGEVSGLLVDGSGGEHAVLLLVDAFDDNATKRAKMFSPAPVLAISPETEINAGKAYLAGLPGIKAVTVLCHRNNCPELTIEAVQSTSPARRYLGKPGRP